MFRKAQDRIRSYFYKTKDDLYHSSEYRENKCAKAEIDFLINNFKKWLMHYGFFGHIFDRTKCAQKINSCSSDNSIKKDVSLNLNSEDDSILQTKRIKLATIENNTSILENSLSVFPLQTAAVCDSFGMFSCQGAWNRVCCIYGDHVINPYISREYRILFQVYFECITNTKLFLI